MARTHYDHFQIALHWFMAVLIACAFGLVWTLEGMSFSPLKMQLLAWHKWAGVSVLLFVALRLIWRVIKGAPAVNAAIPKWQRGIATGVHHLLYMLMFLLPLSGWLLSSANGSPVVYLGIVPLPNLVAEDADLAAYLRDAHELMAASLLLLVGLHAAGAVKHYVLDRDETLARMLPFLKRIGSKS